MCYAFVVAIYISTDITGSDRITSFEVLISVPHLTYAVQIYPCSQTTQCLLTISADQDGCTALMWASRYEHSATVKLLLDKGAKINIADKVCHVICLQYVMTDHIIGRNQASEYKCVHPITNALSFRSNLSSEHISSHQDGCTALMWAARRSSAATVTLLLDKGALINNVDKVWNSMCVRSTCLHTICY